MPSSDARLDFRRLRAHLNQGLAHDIIATAIVETDRGVRGDRLIELTLHGTRDAAHLEDVDKIGVIQQLHGKFHGRLVEVLKGEPVEEYVAGKQLLAPDVHRVLRQIEGVAQRCCRWSIQSEKKTFFLCSRRAPPRGDHRYGIRDRKEIACPDERNRRPARPPARYHPTLR